MDNTALGWLGFARKFEGPGFALFQRELARFNARRLAPSLADACAPADLSEECAVRKAERDFVEAARRKIAQASAEAPENADDFVAWFERLRDSGPGQGDALFPWLAESASLEQMRWFVEQEVAGEAGFEDLLALTQVKMPERAKLEMARNYWDDMG